MTLTPAPVPRYCDTANLTGGLQAPRANRVTFCGSGGLENQDMGDDRVQFVPFVPFRDPLFLDENSSPHALNVHAIVLPGGEPHDVIRNGMGGHDGLRQRRYVKSGRAGLRLRGPAAPPVRCTSPVSAP